MTGAVWSGDTAALASNHLLSTVVLDMHDVRAVLAVDKPLSQTTVLNWINRGRRGILLRAVRTGDGVRAPYGFSPIEVSTFAKFALERRVRWELLPDWLQRRVDDAFTDSQNRFDAGAALDKLRASLSADTPIHPATSDTLTSEGNAS